MVSNQSIPFSFDLLFEEKVILSKFDNHIVRKLSAMRAQYMDQDACNQLLVDGNPILYEVYEVARPEKAGELLQGISIVHPGKVGKEYYMTKGHFHSILETAEVYYCLRGGGLMVMETLAGEWAVEILQPGRVLYVPPGWAHRSVNTGFTDDLVTFFVYPGNSGHDYGSIETQGFRKLILEQNGKPQIEDNPRWLPPEER